MKPMLVTLILALAQLCVVSYGFCDNTKPNVLFILADDLGYGDIGVNGNKIVHTPNIDRLAGEGVLLTQHYSASPLCAPARAALLTGRYNHRTGAVDVPSNRGLDRISLRDKTMGDLFSACGYATGLIGKWHNGLHDMRYHPNNRGFQTFVGFLNGGMDYYKWVIDRNGKPESSDGSYLTDVFTDEACGFIEKNKSRPFFLLVSYNAVHSPFQAPEELIKKYRAKGKMTEELCTLYAMAECMDRGIGQLLKELETQGLRNKTIIVFTSDNGPYLGRSVKRFNNGLKGAKGSAFEGGIRVPAIACYPEKFPAGHKIRELTHFCDWLPTLANLSGVSISECKPLDGIDISNLLSGKEAKLRTVLFWQRNRYRPASRCNGAMREGPWKLIWPMRNGADWKDQGDNNSYIKGLTSPHWLMDVNPQLPKVEIATSGRPLLFNIENDPDEKHDLSAQFPERTSAMTAAWDQWFGEVTGEWDAIYKENVKADNRE